MRTRFLALLLPVMAVSLLTSAPAQAGTWTVHQCRLPNGTLVGISEAPTSGQAGWFADGTVTPNTSDPTVCGSPGESIDVGAVLGNTDLSIWRFRAPISALITGVRAERTFAQPATNAPVYRLAVNGNSDTASVAVGLLESCTTQATCTALPQQSPSVRSFAGLTGSFLHFSSSCETNPTCTMPNLVRIPRIEIDLQDANNPIGSVDGLNNLSGKAPALPNQVQITVDGSDNGAGLFLAELLIDGVPVQSQKFSGSAASCADQAPGTGSTYDFTSLTPCPSNGSASFTTSPRQLPPGSHTVQVRITDASGNTTLAGAPRTWTVIAPECSDTTDNDGDGTSDAADPGCHTDGNPNNPASYDPNDDSEAEALPQCSDGIDNDGDGRTDSQDPACLSGPNGTYNPADDSESPDPQCSDRADNDGDGRVDIADPACHTDGNPNNPASYTPLKDSEADTQCSDGKDNDGDSRPDTLDPGCHSDFNPNNPASYTPLDNNEGDEPVCADNADNDGDGRVDIADPACHTDGNPNNPATYDPTRNSERDAQCSDLGDNDGDKLPDAKDPGCHTDGDASNPASYDPFDDDERDPITECRGTIRSLFWQVEKRPSIRQKLVIRGKTAYAKKGLRVVFRGRVTGCKEGSIMRVNALLPDGRRVQKTGLKVRAGGKFTGFAEQSAGSRRVRVLGKNSRTLTLKRTSTPTRFR